MTTNTAIVHELKRIAADNGGILKAEAVVSAASDPLSPLHSQFDWDESSAAQKWRLWQARQLIRVVVMYEPAAHGKMIRCNVFVSLTPDREDDGGGYRLVSAVMENEDQRRQLLADAQREMVRFRDKYRSLTELAKVFAAIEEAQEAATSSDRSALLSAAG